MDGVAVDLGSVKLPTLHGRRRPSLDLQLPPRHGSASHSRLCLRHGPLRLVIIGEEEEEEEEE